MILAAKMASGVRLIMEGSGPVPSERSNECAKDEKPRRTEKPAEEL
jgi:hypothetical protein